MGRLLQKQLVLNEHRAADAGALTVLMAGYRSPGLPGERSLRHVRLLRRSTQLRLLAKASPDPIMDSV
ncbi:hypothetical protein GCM10027162_33870 [Streptomyces incanus]